MSSEAEYCRWRLHIPDVLGEASELQAQCLLQLLVPPFGGVLSWRVRDGEPRLDFAAAASGFSAAANELSAVVRNNSPGIAKP